MNSEVIALLVSDLHLSHRPPIARSQEPDWYAAMARPLGELRDLSDEFDCPIICSGDIFDRWGACPELINFAICELPQMYAIPGQHDMPYHDYGDMIKSAYWTLTRTKGVVNLQPFDPIVVGKPDGEIALYGFPFGVEPRPRGHRDFNYDVPENVESILRVAVLHRYCWMGKDAYHGAKKEDHVDTLAEQLDGYDIALFGDNHTSFIYKIRNGVTIVNPGSLMRRHLDQVRHKPMVVMLFDDGSVKPHYLDTLKDILIPTPQKTSEQATLDLGDFIDDLDSLGDGSLDFGEAVALALKTNRISEKARRLILEVLEDV